jgi:hypothetical protein
VSSAILYLAIIAIWAGFLVPAWLRRPHANSDSGAVDSADAESTAEPQATVQVEEYVEASELTVEFVDEIPYTESDVDDAGAETGIHAEASQHAYSGQAQAQGPEHHTTFVYSEVTEYAEDFGPEYPVNEDAEPDMESADVGSGPPAPRPSQSRDQMLRARRRMLSILVGMTAVTGLFTFIGVVAWWIMVPPAMLLVLYALLLREIAMADSELARKRAAWEAADQRAYERYMRAQARVDAERQAYEAATAGSGAQIIDISGRVSDQLYDQYADAAVRAVGD